jgi:preprotein translocase subunit SecY
MFMMWLGEQITSRGVGNGISLIIFSGIVAALPGALGQLFTLTSVGQLNAIVLLLILVLAISVVLFIVFIERSQRRLLVQYPKRQQGGRQFGGESSFLPLKVNTAGVIPPIFASSLLLLPTTLLGLWANQGPDWLGAFAGQLQHGRPLFMLLYGALIIFFCFFYTSIIFNPEETAENLRKHGGFLPGIRPGKRTADYIDTVLTRLTVIGAAYITVVCLLPEALSANFGQTLYFGGTSLLIVVTVTMDTVAQIQSHLLAHQYEGLIKKSRLRTGSPKASTAVRGAR